MVIHKMFHNGEKRNACAYLHVYVVESVPDISVNGVKGHVHFARTNACLLPKNKNNNCDKSMSLQGLFGLGSLSCRSSPPMGESDI